MDGLSLGLSPRLLKLQLQSFRQPSEEPLRGLLCCLGVVMASVSRIGEGSHDHDRDDRSASEEGDVQMTVHEGWY